MLDFKSVTRQASRERKSLRKQLEAARETVDRLTRELAKLDSVLGILTGRGVRPGRAGGGKWRPGRPGRPPNWWREQQKGKGGRKGGKKAGKRRGRRAAATPAASAAS